MTVVSSLGNQVLFKVHQDGGHEECGKEEVVFQFACKCLSHDGFLPFLSTDV